jgi:hypothetical protein
MADALSKMWAKFSLSVEEDSEVKVQAKDFLEVTLRGHSCVVGKMVGDRYVSKETIKNMLKCWWRPLGTMSFRLVGDNLFIVEFETGRDKKRVMEGCPWVFKGNLFLVEEYDPLIPLAKLTFNRASFWVWMSQLPLGCMG